MVDASTVIPPDDKAQISATLEEDAQLMSTTQLNEQLAGEPQDVADEVIAINEQARPIALQVALFIPILAGLDRHRQRLPDASPPRPGAVGERGVRHRRLTDLAPADVDDLRARAVTVTRLRRVAASPR